MCGIVGYIGKNNATPAVIDGLRSLEYRGYDSAGITQLIDNALITSKSVGQVDLLEKAMQQNTSKTTHSAIGHTRWATHGLPTQMNAHPHTNTNQTISVVHNGIIENYQEIRMQLQKRGYTFQSDTDTEVIPHLIDYYMGSSSTFAEALEKTLLDLRGAYAIAVMHLEEPAKIYVARLSSPLVIGVGTNEHFIASDPTAVSGHTNKVIFLDDFEMAEVTRQKVKIRHMKKSVVVQRAAEELSPAEQKAALGDFPHFMLKEIFEAPQTVQTATRGRVRGDTNTIKLGGLDTVVEQLRFIDRIVIVACGTSYYAGLVGEYLIEELTDIPVEVQLASEFKYRQEPFSRSTALIAISQSGETADTIAALKKVEGFGVLRLGIVNATGSTIARMTDAGVYCHAGPEQSVASTKAFIAQVTILAEVALHLSRGNNPHYKPVLQELLVLPQKIQSILDSANKIQEIAREYAKYRDFLYIGRNYLYPCALEGALKLKEISYIHAEGYAAGEMKHGPLAMIDENFPTFAITPENKLLEKTLSNLEEIRSRKGPIVALANSYSSELKSITKDIIVIPKTLPQLEPILVAVAMQLFSYYIAVEKKLNVDRPRNLAKSVTVE